MPAALSAANDAFAIRPERPQDAQIVDVLVAEAFGPGRFVKSAERLREGRRPDPDLSLIAWDGEIAAGCVRQWPIHIGERPAILLGPFAVAAAYRNRGVGAALVDAACLAAAAAGHQVIVLVGDAPFFERLGFEVVPAGRAQMPGPVNPGRVLWRPLVPGALEGLGGDVRA